MEDYLLQPQPSQLSYGAELRSVKRYVGDERQRWITLKETRHGCDVHDAIGCRVENYDTNRLSAYEGFELLPRGSDQQVGLVSKNVLDVGEEPGRQERRNAH